MSVCGTWLTVFFLEVFTGEVPFRANREHLVPHLILLGKRPAKPNHPTLTEDLWHLIQRCWDDDPDLRPEASEVLQILLKPSSVSHPFLWSSTRLTDQVLMCREPPTWGKLIRNDLPTHERVSLITSIFSDRNQVESVGLLSGSDAQAFVDVIDEVNIRTLLPQRIGWLTPVITTFARLLGYG